MGDSIPQSRWRRTIGVANCLTGAVLVGLSIFCAVAGVRLAVSRDFGALSALLWASFTGGIGGGLLWIGVGDYRGRKRPTWIVRVTLYVCVIATITPMLFVAREANRKRQTINNLNTLRETLRQYESKWEAPHGAPPDTMDPGEY